MYGSSLFGAEAFAEWRAPPKKAGPARRYSLAELEQCLKEQRDAGDPDRWREIREEVEAEHEAAAKATAHERVMAGIKAKMIRTEAAYR